MRRTVKIPDAEGVTTDPAARAGEGTTVEMLPRRCPRCGGRMQRIKHRYSGDELRAQCRGCGR